MEDGRFGLGLCVQRSERTASALTRQDQTYIQSQIDACESRWLEEHVTDPMSACSQWRHRQVYLGSKRITFPGPDLCVLVRILVRFLVCFRVR